MLKVKLSSGQEYSLPREALLQRFPRSILAQAIADDPEATQITLMNPAVTPEALDVIGLLLLGAEPLETVPELESAADYLDMPELLIYTDIYYDALDHPVTDTPNNRQVLVNAAGDGDVKMIHYLLDKGVSPYATEFGKLISPPLNASIRADSVAGFETLWPAVTLQPGHAQLDVNDVLDSIILSDAANILAYLRLDPTVTAVLVPTVRMEQAVSSGAERIAHYLAVTYLSPADIGDLFRQKILEDDPTASQILHQEVMTDYADDFYLIQAMDFGSNRVARQLLTDPGYIPYYDHYLRSAVEEGNRAVVELLLPLTDAGINDNDLLKSAVYDDQTTIIRLLLDDPHVKPETIVDANGNLRYYIKAHTDSDAVQLLWADGRLPRYFFE